MSATVVPSRNIDSFADPRLHELREELRARISAATPPSWPEVRELLDEETVVLEARRDWDRRRVAAGIGCIGWPVEHGGNAFTPVESFEYGELIEEMEAPAPLNWLGYGLAGTAIINWGNPEQQKRFLPRILNGQDLWCEGFSEPGGGADMASCQTTATRTDSGWHIKGSKIWTTLGPWADRIYCLVRSSLTAPKRHNLSVFLLDLHAPGIEVRPIKQIHGLDAFAQVFIDTDVPDADDLLLGNEGEGWNLSSLVGAHRGGRVRRVSGAGTPVTEPGTWIRRLRHCLDEAGAGEPMRKRVDELGLRAEALRWQRKRLIELAMAERETTRASIVMKITMTELSDAMTACGMEIGCSQHEEYWRGRHLNDRKYSIAGGPNEIHRDLIANRVLGMGR